METRVLIGKASEKLLDLLKNSEIDKEVVIGQDENGNNIIFTKRS